MTANTGWQPLPARARSLFLLAHGATWGALALVSLVPITLLVPRPLPALPLALASLVLLPAWGLWMAIRRYRYTRWLLDDTGLGYRRGRMWQTETRVPRTRVQHVDLKHGPLERRFGLATLVVHTAGTRDSAVAVAGLDAAEATRLRDRLAQQVDDDDADDA
ncbi:PH domain-containing protein [Luteimonas terricola]|uniref:Membrane protein n=1 Tax=Luteimonas terricola TaxID=645597 RepID=A0ABQ2E6E8_9GAMM|nr:PH domain-containing protein [Luteimonas terricola]GGJ97465.1 membrane protein [Luteimonas terricola]